MVGSGIAWPPWCCWLEVLPVCRGWFRNLRGIGGVGVFKLLKAISRRERPCHLEPHCWATILPPDKFSFPSGHTMTAFSIALVVAFSIRASKGPLYFLAISIAVSRVVLGMHFLSDVLAGAVLGSALGVTAIVVFASYGLI